MRGFLAANTPATLILLGGHSQAAVVGALFYMYALPEVLCGIREWVDVVPSVRATADDATRDQFGTPSAAPLSRSRRLSGSL